MHFHDEISKTFLKLKLTQTISNSALELSRLSLGKSFKNSMINLENYSENQNETQPNEPKPKKSSRISSYWKPYCSMTTMAGNCLRNKLTDRSTTCCGCCNLEIGCKIVALFEVLVSMIGLGGLYFDYWQYINSMIYGILIGFILYSGVVTRFELSLVFYLVLTAIRFTICLAIGIVLMVISIEGYLPLAWVAYGLFVIIVICGEIN